MGIKLFGSSSSFDTPKRKSYDPNPDPSNYKILKHIQIGNFLILKIKYYDCTNFEGEKILVFENTLENVLKQKSIDPHFSDNKKFISPIARFEPTIKGWEMATFLTKNL